MSGFKITQPNPMSRPASGGTPGGAAGGDLGGTFPGPTVSGLQGTPICVTAPSPGEALIFDGTEWCPAGLVDSVTVQELDGTPSVAASRIDVPNGSLTVVAGTVARIAYVTPVLGGQEFVDTNAAAGATATLDCSLANIFDLTLTANCTISITNPPAAGVSGQITVILRQGGTGSYTVTWPASVAWQDPLTGLTGGSAPVLFTAVGAENVVDLSTLDGGVTWGGSVVGSALTVKDEGSALATAATSLDFVGAGVVASGTGAAKTITIAGVTAAAITALGFVGGILMQDGATSPPVPLWTEAGDDYLYADL